MNHNKYNVIAFNNNENKFTFRFLFDTYLGKDFFWARLL